VSILSYRYHLALCLNTEGYSDKKHRHSSSADEEYLQVFSFDNTPSSKQASKKQQGSLVRPSHTGAAGGAWRSGGAGAANNNANLINNFITGRMSPSTLASSYMDPHPFDVATQKLSALGATAEASHYYPAGDWGPSAGIGMHLSSKKTNGPKLHVVEQARSSLSRGVLDDAIMSGQAHNVDKMADIHHIHREVSITTKGNRTERFTSVKRHVTHGGSVHRSQPHAIAEVVNENEADPIAEHHAIVAALAAFEADADGGETQGTAVNLLRGVCVAL
jgi:hypothetical protein